MRTPALAIALLASLLLGSAGQAMDIVRFWWTNRGQTGHWVPTVVVPPKKAYFSEIRQ